MLNPFPELLTFAVLAPTILRLIVAIVFISLASDLMGKDKASKIVCFDNAGFRPGRILVPVAGIVSLIGGVLILIGLWTQVSSIALGIVTLGAILMKKRGAENLVGPMSYYVMLLFILLSLILTGAGAFALDLPL